MRYRVTVLTPTLVGDGQRLSPIDYMVWKDQVNVLDQRRIFKMLAKGPRLEPYLEQIRRATKLDFASWGGYAQNYAVRRIPFEHPLLTKAFEAARPDSLHIPLFANTPTGPVLPGSAVRGAIRTALTFLRWRDRGVEKVLEQAAERVAGDRIPRYLSQPFDNSEPKAKPGDARLTAGGFKIYQVRTSRLQQGVLSWKDTTPSFAEMATPGTTFEGAWTSDPKSAGRAAAPAPWAESLLEGQILYATQAKLPVLAAKLEELRGKPGLLSIGWGGGFLGKAAAHDTTQAAYRTVLRAMPFYSRAIQTGLPFPKTRRILSEGPHPAFFPGWVSLEVLDK